MCSMIGVGERLHKVLGQIDFGTLDSGERSALWATCSAFRMTIASFWVSELLGFLGIFYFPALQKLQIY